MLRFVERARDGRIIAEGLCEMVWAREQVYSKACKCVLVASFEPKTIGFVVGNSKRTMDFECSPDEVIELRQAFEERVICLRLVTGPEDSIRCHWLILRDVSPEAARVHAKLTWADLLAAEAMAVQDGLALEEVLEMIVA